MVTRQTISPEHFKELMVAWKQGISEFFHNAMNQIQPKTDYVLEVGYGNSTPLLKAKFGKYHLKVLDKSPRVEDHIDYLMDLCVPNAQTEETWNYIFCLDVLEHAKQPWILAENISTMLKPRGKIMVTVPTDFPWHPMLPVCGDYWRFYPDSLEILFPNLVMIQNDRVYYNNALLGLTATFQQD